MKLSSFRTASPHAAQLYASKVLANLPFPKGKKAVAPTFLESVRGDFTAPVCVIAPPPTAEEIQTQLPLSDKDAVILHSLILEETGYDTDKDFLVVSCALVQEKNRKTSKSATAPVREFITALSEHASPKLYVCVGGESFKHIFGRGKLPSMSMLAGSVIYHQDIQDKPLFTFPDIQGLHPTPLIPDNSDAYMVRRAQKAANDWADLQTRNFRKHLRSFAEVLKKLKI